MSLTHLDDAGAARMVDVSGKHPTLRTATAEGRIRMSAAAASICSCTRSLVVSEKRYSSTHEK